MSGSRRKKRTTTERGYGWGHQLTRARLAPLVASGKAVCTQCGERIEPGSKWHLDHTSDRLGYAGVAHAYCNTTAPHRREARRLQLGDYPADDPERGIFYGPPSVCDGTPTRWSRLWFDWRPERDGGR